MNKKLQPVLLLAAAFTVLAIWRNPAVAAGDVGQLVGNIGGLLQVALGKIAEFLGSFGS